MLRLLIQFSRKMSCCQINGSNFEGFLNSFDTILTDCDGVLWHGMTPIPGAASALSKLRKLGKKVFFVTNNSTKTREEYLKKFHGLEFEAELDEIFSSSYAAACYLKNLKFNKKVYIVGTNGISQELDRVNIQHLGVGPDIVQGTIIDLIQNGVELDPEVGAVIVGFDEHFSFTKIMKAASYLNDPKCIFLSTNTDERFPMPSSNLVMPGSGSLLASVQVAAQREPIVLGKPMRYLFDAISSIHKIDPKRTIMIGDRLNTDILLGHNCGIMTLLVLTGISSLYDVQQLQKSALPEDKKMLPEFYTEGFDTLDKLMT